MFKFYQNKQTIKNIKLTKKLNPHTLTFNK